MDPLNQGEVMSQAHSVSRSLVILQQKQVVKQMGEFNSSVDVFTIILL